MPRRSPVRRRGRSRASGSSAPIVPRRRHRQITSASSWRRDASLQRSSSARPNSEAIQANASTGAPKASSRRSRAAARASRSASTPSGSDSQRARKLGRRRVGGVDGGQPSRQVGAGVLDPHGADRRAQRGVALQLEAQPQVAPRPGLHQPLVGLEGVVRRTGQPGDLSADLAVVQRRGGGEGGHEVGGDERRRGERGAARRSPGRGWPAGRGGCCRRSARKPRLVVGGHGGDADRGAVGDAGVEEDPAPALLVAPRVELEARRRTRQRA